MSTIIDKLHVKLKHTSLNFKLPKYIQRLNQLEEQFLRLPTIKQQTNIKCLMGPSFSIYEPCFIHDRILALALRLRGVEVISMYCDQLQQHECNVYAGRWMNTSFKRSCASCASYSQLMWPKKYYQSLEISKFVSKNDKTRINEVVDAIDEQQWHKYCEGEYIFGQWSKDILVNSYMVGDHLLVENHSQLGKRYIENLKRMKLAYERALNQIKPDRVVTNDSFYGMWGVLQVLSKERNIDFYSQWEGDRKHAWCYAHNDAAMNLDFSKPWKKFSSQPLTAQSHAKVDHWVKNRVKGEDMILNTASVASHHTDLACEQIFNSKKPKALLCANVIWDCAALNKQIVFDDMMDWIIETIQWFAKNPQFELIIKPHPVEENPLLPKTIETVAEGLKQRNVKLPENVMLLSAKVNLTVYELFPLVQMGIVHTTSVGMEMAAIGKPVITSAKSPYRGFGFTEDPTSKQQYFEAIANILSEQYPFNFQERIEAAYKFISFYRFHYYTKINIMDYEFSKEPTVLINDLEELLPGNNAALDYIVDSIINGLPIISESRWMHET